MTMNSLCYEMGSMFNKAISEEKMKKKRKIFLNRSCPYIFMQIHRADFIVVIVAEVSDVADGPLCINNCNY